MDLTQEEVDAYMAAEKVVRGKLSSGQSLRMEWEKATQDRYLWRAPVEVDAVRVGDLFLFANPSIDRGWTFKLSLRGEVVREWNIRPDPGNHNNPPDCPEGFPRKVPEREHEHVWIEGFGRSCARPLEGLGVSDHRAIFEAFCDRTNVRFEPDYVAPQAGEQLSLD